MAAIDTTEAGAPPAPASRSRWRETLGIVARNRLALFGMLILAILIVVAVTGPYIAPYGFNEINVPDRLTGPSLEHPFGTDDLGRDVFSRVLLGARVSLLVGFVAVGISLTAGTVFGLVAGFYGKRTDDLIMRLMDVLFAFPAMLMAIAVLAILGPGTVNAMTACTRRSSPASPVAVCSVSVSRCTCVPPAPWAQETSACSACTSCPTCSHRSSCRPASAWRSPSCRRPRCRSWGWAPSRRTRHGGACCRRGRGFIEHPPLDEVRDGHWSRCFYQVPEQGAAGR